MPDNGDDQDSIFDHHPDLIDERWAKKAAKAAKRQARKDRRAAAADRPVGSPYRPAGRRMPGMQAILSVVLLVGGVLLISRHPWSGSSSSGPVRSLAPAPPSVTVTTRQDAPLDLNQPFGDTPAAGWRDGGDGIEPPAAVVVGRYSANQVADLQNRVKQVLIAAHLDQRMLVNHDPTAYLALFSPRSRDFERQQLDQHAVEADDGGRFTFLATGFHLLPAPIKVSGSMSTVVGPDGRLLVHTNYVFAYPFAPADPASITQPWQIVAIRHVAEDFGLTADTTHYDAASQGLDIGDTQSYDASMACNQSKLGYLAPAYSEQYTGAPDTANPDVYYDPTHTFQVPSC